MVLNLGLARGYVGREKTGLMPIRGHSSVQGGAEMGCYSTALPGGKPLTPANLSDLAAKYGFPIPDWPGLTSVEMIEASARGDLDVLYCLGGNFLRTLPDPERVAASLRNVPVRVHQDIVLVDQMMEPAREEVLLLPAKTRYEQDEGGIETTTERRIAFSPELPRVVGEARAEWKILRDLAAAAHPERAHQIGGADGWKLREEIATPATPSSTAAPVSAMTASSPPPTDTPTSAWFHCLRKASNPSDSGRTASRRASSFQHAGASSSTRSSTPRSIPSPVPPATPSSSALKTPRACTWPGATGSA